MQSALPDSPQRTPLSAASDERYCSVVIPVYNGAASILRCLDALAQQTVPPERYEIIVVDDGSRDQTPALVRAWAAQHPRVTLRLERQANAGPAAARNRGAALAEGALLLFTDADCAPVPDWIEALSAPFAHVDEGGEPVVGVKGVYRTDQTGLTPRFVQAEYEDRYDLMRGLAQIDFIDTYSAAYRRDIFLAHGGFDESFPTASVEDQEFSFRLARQGYRMVFEPAAQVLHLHDADLADYWRRKFYIGYWKALLLRQHPDRMVRDSHTPQVLKVQMAIWCALVALLPAAGIGSIWRPGRWLWRPVLLLLALFLATVAPLQRKLVRRSPLLALAAPILLAVRSLALSAGLLAGLCRFGLNAGPRARSHHLAANQASRHRTG